MPSLPPFVATFTVHALGGAAVIVVEPAEHGNGLDDEDAELEQLPTDPLGPSGDCWSQSLG